MEANQSTIKKRKVEPEPRARKKKGSQSRVISKPYGLDRKPRSSANKLGESDSTPLVISSDESDGIVVLSTPPSRSPVPITTDTGKSKVKTPPEPPIPLDVPNGIAEKKIDALPTVEPCQPSSSKLPRPEEAQVKPLAAIPDAKGKDVNNQLSQSLEQEEDGWYEGDDEGYGMEEPDEDVDSSVATEDTIDYNRLKGQCLGNIGVQDHNKAHEADVWEASEPEDAGDPVEIDSKAPQSPESIPQSKAPNAFSVLMNGHKEKAEWKVAEIDLKRDGKRHVGRRRAPFYKVMTGMPIAVDAFRYGRIPNVNAYFLTHAHSDHYTNLSSSWSNGPIYCSETTANLIKLMLGVDPKWVHGIPWDTPFIIPNTNGVSVTVLHANHCPGSSLFLFTGRQTVDAGDSLGFKSPYIGSKRIWRYLHCGDFRACPQMILHPAIAGKPIDTCYLDTTYLNPQYCFPPQPLVIDACATLAKRSFFGRHVPAVTDASGGRGVMGGEGKQTMEKGKDEPVDESDIKPFLKGLEGLEMDERGRRLMSQWLVKEEDQEEDTKDRDLVQTNKTGRILVIIG